MNLRPVLFVLFGLALTYSGYWYYAAYHAEGYITELADAWAEKGIQVRFDDIKVGGYPYRLEMEIQDLQVAFESNALSVSLSADNAQFIVQPWNFRHGILQAPVANIIVEENGVLPNRVSISTYDLAASGRLESDGSGRFSATLTRGTLLAGNTRAPLGDSEFHVRLPTPAETSITNELMDPLLAEIVLRATVAPGPAATALNAHTSLRGTTAPGTTGASLRAWQEGGGTWEITALDVSGPSGTLRGNGSFTVDEDLLPLGVLAFEAETGADLVGLARASGFLGRTELRVLEQFIGPTGNPIQLSLMLQGGQVTLNGFPIGSVSPLSDD